MDKKRGKLTIRKKQDSPVSERPRERFVPNKDEVKLYGVNACRAVWKSRPQDVVKLYLLESRIPHFSDMLKWASQQRIAYHIVANDDLNRLTQSEHHEGVCMVVIDKRAIDFHDWMLDQQAENPTDNRLLLMVDGVENPHNLGALVRTCAHFGIRYVLGDARKLPRLSAAATRVAEGGGESVDLIALPNAADALRELKSMGYQCVTTSSHEGESIYDVKFPARTILILGAESHGVSKDLEKLADIAVTIPGSGNVESLNVAAAFAVLASSYRRDWAE